MAVSGTREDNLYLQEGESIQQPSKGTDYVTPEGLDLPKQVKKKDILELYERDEVFHREVRKELSDMFDRVPEVESENEELQDMVEDLFYGDLDLYKKLKKASQGAYLDGYCLLYFNYDAGKIDEEPSNINDITQIGILYDHDVIDYVVDEDLTSNNFGDVSHWRVSVGGNNHKVHHSRLLHVIYDSTYNNPKGLSKASPEFDNHMFRQLIEGGYVTAYRQNSVGIKMFEMREGYTQEEKEWVKSEIKGLLNRREMVVPNGTKLHHPAPEIIDPVSFYKLLLETGPEMPYQVLSGIQAGAVTGSETNLQGYYMEIQRKREKIINDLLMDKVKYLQKKGYLPEGKVELNWGEMFEPTDQERANAYMQYAMTVERLWKAGIMTTEEAREWMQLDPDNLDKLPDIDPLDFLKKTNTGAEGGDDGKEEDMRNFIKVMKDGN